MKLIENRVVSSYLYAFDASQMPSSLPKKLFNNFWREKIETKRHKQSPKTEHKINHKHKRRPLSPFSTNRVRI